MRIALAFVVLAGCVGEASVSYHGSVIEGPASSFAFEPSPAAGTPIVGARVAVCIASCGDPVITDATGAYPLLDEVFGGFVGSDTNIEVRVTAPDGRTFSYRTVFESTKDPTIADDSVYLNFTLAP